VLLLPGGLGSAVFYDDVLAYAALDEHAVRLVAATPPGFAVLLSPTFSRQDEFKELAVLDRIGDAPGIGALVWAMVPRIAARALRSNLPSARRDLLVAEIRRNRGQVCVAWFAATSTTSTMARRWCAASPTPASPRGSSSAITRRSA
jgi:hypothetical protein